MVPHRRTGIYGIRQPVFYSPCGSSSCLCFRQIVSMDYLLDTLQRYPCTVLCTGSRQTDGYPTWIAFTHQYTNQFIWRDIQYFEEIMGMSPREYRKSKKG